MTTRYEAYLVFNAEIVDVVRYTEGEIRTPGHVTENENFRFCYVREQVSFGKLPWVARMGEERAVYRVLVGKPEGKSSMGRPMRRWVDDIRMDIQEVGCGYMEWIGLVQDRDSWRTFVRAVMNLQVP